jgi:ornithine cyclodeaminase/alanine dehydrogenase-like protein (mu-crystallin family)
MIVLSHADVRSVLDLDRLLDVLAEAMTDLSADRTSMPPRSSAMVPERHGMLFAMPAFLPSSAVLATKLVSLFPLNTDRPTHQAVICCFDPADGKPLALMDGTYITAMRTAAGSALATRLLARRDARTACVIGTGVQAHAHVTLLARQPGLDRIRVAGRDAAKVARLVDELAEAGLRVEAAPSIEEGVRSADVVCATTHSDRPVVRRPWLRPGAHVNVVGWNATGEGEVDAETIRDSLVVVESRAAALAGPSSAGAFELRRAIESGVIPADHVHAEIGELLSGTMTGRSDDHQITLYRSVGVAVQDAAAAGLVLRGAQEHGVGTVLALEEQ